MERVKITACTTAKFFFNMMGVFAEEAEKKIKKDTAFDLRQLKTENSPLSSPEQR